MVKRWTTPSFTLLIDAVTFRLRISQMTSYVSCWCCCNHAMWQLLPQCLAAGEWLSAHMMAVDDTMFDSLYTFHTTCSHHFISVYAIHAVSEFCFFLLENLHTHTHTHTNSTQRAHMLMFQILHTLLNERYLSPDRVTLWRSLARAHGAALPTIGHCAEGSTASRIATRNSRNLKMAFFKGVCARRRAVHALADREVWQIWMTMHTRDCPAAVRRLINTHPEVQLSHALSFYGQRTLAMLAAWRGRLRTLQEVVKRGGSRCLATADEGGFTPLCFAAWAGHRHVVAWLVEQPEVVFDQEGIPPLTSSCGGRGPHTAEVRALQHHNVWAFGCFSPSNCHVVMESCLELACS